MKKGKKIYLDPLIKKRIPGTTIETALPRRFIRTEKLHSTKMTEIILALKVIFYCCLLLILSMGSLIMLFGQLIAFYTPDMTWMTFNPFLFVLSIIGLILFIFITRERSI